MAEILLITYHNALSYGACLQTIATVKILEKYGHAITVIDFQNEYEARQKELKFFKYGSFKEIIASCVKRIFFHYGKYKKRAFGEVTKHYKMTERKYSSIEEMNSLRAEIFIVGSDQVWNSKISGNLEKAFFLDFGVATKRISFSSSMGNYVFKEEEKEYVSRKLNEFTSISVRENYTKNQMETLIDKNIYIMLDPTLMITNLEWKKFYEKSYMKIREEKYILAFIICNHKENLSKIYKYYKTEMKLPVLKIMLNTYKNNGVDKVIAGPTVEEYVQLIDNAELVITDSFHGLAFSINMETPFVLVPVDNGSVRMFELLKNTQLESQIYKENYYPDYKTIDFSRSREYLHKKRIEDGEWIANNIV